MEETSSDIDQVIQTVFFFRRGLIYYDLGKIDGATKAFREGDALFRLWVQPPGIFPNKRYHTYLDCLALHAELRDLLIENDIGKYHQHWQQRAALAAVSVSLAKKLQIRCYSLPGRALILTE